MLNFLLKKFMTTTIIKTGSGFALMVGLALAIAVANAQIMSAAEAPEGISIMGLGMGSVPDYMGSATSKRGVIPVFRY